MSGALAWLAAPHLWAAVALVMGVYATVAPEPYATWLKATATAASGLVALCLQWQREDAPGGNGLPPRPLSAKEIAALGDHLIDKTAPADLQSSPLPPKLGS